MAIDEKILKKIKDKDKLERLKKILKKRLPDLEKRGKDEKDTPKKDKLPDDFLEKFKEQFKDKKKRDDFFKRIDPKDKRKFYDIMPYKPNPEKRFLEPMPYKIDPNKKMPEMEPMPYKIKPGKKPGIQLLKKGGTVKGYKAGGEVKTDKSPNSGMITKRGWGASRKT